ncbi:MAG: hypothetical protein PHV34_14595 [Verrucomicrobiae bacterium]|nr:hypothetical protein [Verrucomicrobiae bacterium]
MNKKFDTVKMARKWREQVSREVAGMSVHEKITHFKRFSPANLLPPKHRKEKSLSKQTAAP